MRRLVLSTSVTLDGVFEGPADWSIPFWDDEAMRFKHDELFASDALLLGRVTYEGFAAAWPSMTDEHGFADRMNSLPKYVVSTTLEEATWNNSRLIRENVIEEVAALKGQTGGDILLAGSAVLMHSLLPHNLIDEYRFLLHPIVVGNGQRLFSAGIDSTVLRLAGTRAFCSGVVVLTYHPAPPE